MPEKLKGRDQTISVLPWSSRLGVGLRADITLSHKALLIQKPEAEEIQLTKKHCDQSSHKEQIEDHTCGSTLRWVKT